MYEKWEDYLEEKVNSIRMDSKALSVQEIKQNMHSLFGVEYSKDIIKNELLKKKELLEIQENLFVCKMYFVVFFNEIKDDLDKIKIINRHYFIQLTPEEEKKLLIEMGNENPEAIVSNLPVEESDKEIEKENVIRNSSIEKEENIEIYSILGLDYINYGLDDVCTGVIRFIEKTKKSIKLNNIDGNSDTKEERKLLSRYTGEGISNRVGQKNELFYMASKKNIFFKPFLGALIIERGTTEISYEEIEKVLKDVLEIPSINRKELRLYFQENTQIFKGKNNGVKILCTLDEYVNYIKSKFEKESKKNLEECEILKGSLGKKVEDFAREKKVNEEDLTFYINKNNDFIVIDGIVKSYEEKSWDKDMQKIITSMEYIDENFPEKFQKKHLKKVIENILSKEAMSKEEILERYWLFQDKISVGLLEEILSNEGKYKKVDKERYALKGDSRYSKYRNNFKEEWEEYLKDFKDIEKKLLTLKLKENLTLSEIGRTLELTKQRISQVNKNIEKKIRVTDKIKLAPYLGCIEEILKKSKIVHKSKIEEKIKGEVGFEDFQISELLNIYGALRGLEIHEYYDSYFGIIDNKKLEETLSMIEDRVINYKELKGFFKGLGITAEDFIKDFLDKDSRNCEYKNLVFRTTKNVVIADKLRLIFEDEKRELKIREITNLYNSYYKQNNTEGSIQSKLDIDKFTRVFIGTYRLTSWGGETHVFTKDLVINYMRKAKRPLNIEEIVAGVRDKTRANDPTIRVFTSMSDDTFAYTHGEWALKEWADDPELSIRYYISENRIEASEGYTVHKSHKGTFIKNGKTTNLYHVNGMFFKHGGHLNLGVELPYVMDNDLKILYKDNIFERRFSNSRNINYIYGVKDLIESIGVKKGDYIYLVFINENTLRLYTWDDFEDEEFYDDEDRVGTEIPWDERRKDETPSDEWCEDEEPYKKEETDIIFRTYAEAERYGLDNGFVKKSLLQGIDYDEEYEVEDIYEAMEELESKGIKITED